MNTNDILISILKQLERIANALEVKKKNPKEVTAQKKEEYDRGYEDSLEAKKEYRVGDVGPAGGIIFLQFGPDIFMECWVKDEPNLMTWDSAKEYIRNINYGGYSDWSLPNGYELDEMYRTQHRIRNFHNDYYWSDMIVAEYSKRHAPSQHLGSGQQKPELKDNLNRVCVVRRFKI